MEFPPLAAGGKIDKQINKKYRKTGVFSFYRRKLFFFVIMMAVGYFSYLSLRLNSYKADEPLYLSDDAKSEQSINLAVTSQGNIIVNNRETGKKVSFLTDFDELRLPVIDQPDRYYDNVTITLTLPGDFADRVNHQILAIHGVGAIDSEVKGNRTIVYQASDVSAYATVSVVAEIPKGLIRPDIMSQVKTTLGGLKANVWITLGIALPTLTFIFVTFFLLHQSKRQRIEIPDQEISAPPMAIPPALAGVLVHQRVRPREVAATLIDLAIRGDIVILDRERGFAFGKHKFDNRLLGYEKILLTKIFHQSLSSSRAEIEQRINNHFYSKKISIVSAGIYALATRLGYFQVNPQRVYAKYRFIGIGMLLIGLTGFGLNISVFTGQPFLVFFWIGMMLSALIVTFSVSRIPIRTPLGQEALSNWLAFKKYLSNPEPISYDHEISGTFQRYLPYAIILDCEAAWAKRFLKHNFVMPPWYLTDKGGLGLEDFCLSLFPIISYVSRSLTALREPGFE